MLQAALHTIFPVMFPVMCSLILDQRPLDSRVMGSQIKKFSFFYYLLLYLVSALEVGGEGNGNPLQYSCLENPMDGGAWKVAVHGVAESKTQLSDFTFTFYFHALEKEMATHSSVLAWRIPGTGEPGGVPSVGSHRVGHD